MGAPAPPSGSSYGILRDPGPLPPAPPPGNTLMCWSVEDQGEEERRESDVTINPLCNLLNMNDVVFPQLSTRTGTSTSLRVSHSLTGSLLLKPTVHRKWLKVSVSDQSYQTSGVYAAAEPSSNQVTQLTSDLLSVSESFNQSYMISILYHLPLLPLWPPTHRSSLIVCSYLEVQVDLNWMLWTLTMWPSVRLSSSF